MMKTLKNEFEMRAINTKTFLGFQYEIDNQYNIKLHQQIYIKSIIEKFNMNEANPMTSPIAQSSQTCDSKQLGEEIPFRAAVGSLLNAARYTRPDISFAVGKVTRKQVTPAYDDWTAIKRILRYLRMKEDLGIVYRSENLTGLTAFCDADYAGGIQTSKSTTGFVFQFAGGPIDRRSQIQKMNTLSSTESESIAVCTTIREGIGIKNLATELGITKEEPIQIYCDNRNAIELINGRQSIHRTRHIAAQINFCKEKVEEGQIKLPHISAEDQLADMLTKATSNDKFISNKNRLMNNLSLATLAICSVLSLVSADHQIMEPGKPVIWLPTNHYVETNIFYDITLKFMRPCDKLPYSDQDPTLTYSISDPKYEDYTVWKDTIEKCGSHYEEQWISKVRQIDNLAPAKRRHKRGLIGDIMIGGGGIAIGASISNLVSTFFPG